MAEERGPVQRYRFRVRTAEGRELISSMAELLLPRPLAAPRWSASSFSPGDEAKLSARAPGRDGQSLLFHLERLAAGAWERLAHASAEVMGGVAEAAIAMPHLPGAAADPHRVRFVAVAADGVELASEEARLCPAASAAPGLRRAAFGHGAYREGESAALRVEADGFDGREIRFFLERRDGGGPFQAVAEARATVAGGLARALAAIPIPAARSAPAAAPVAGGAPPARGQTPAALRFRALCDFSSVDSEQVPLEPAPAERLRNPGWAGAVPGQGASFAHGEQAQMRVEAPGLDGRTVRFVVEQRLGGGWSHYGVATGVVQQGVALAQVPAAHPLVSSGGPVSLEKLHGAAPLPMRFRCELLPAEAGRPAEAHTPPIEAGK